MITTSQTMHCCVQMTPTVPHNEPSTPVAFDPIAHAHPTARRSNRQRKPRNIDRESLSSVLFGSLGAAQEASAMRTQSCSAAPSHTNEDGPPLLRHGSSEMQWESYANSSEAHGLYVMQPMNQAVPAPVATPHSMMPMSAVPLVVQHTVRSSLSAAAAEFHQFEGAAAAQLFYKAHNTSGPDQGGPEVGGSDFCSNPSQRLGVVTHSPTVRVARLVTRRDTCSPLGKVTTRFPDGSKRTSVRGNKAFRPQRSSS
jgi:hypothetical protein